ncbi:MAG TPA: hypothetical protein PKL49_03305 [Steroidobacteraceae bacterium]|nr:hypothetical protein [Steroidobacteraceae bacterium]HNS27049.1 hypothetical protein [Steroidobacteraceae bacterium]
MKPQWIALAMIWVTSAPAQPTPNVQIELAEIDPAGVPTVAPHTPVYGRIVYTTDAPVRLVLLPYRNGQPVLDGLYNSGSPRYAPGSGETIAWFAFDEPQTIDEIRAVANDFYGNVFAEDSIVRNLNWREGAPKPQKAAWVEPLKRAGKDVIVEPPAEYGWFATVVTQLFFLLVPLSVGLQIHAWRKLDGGPGRLARLSGYAMGALWLFVILTGVAGSNLSPIWIVFLSPLFVLFLGALLLVARTRRRRFA